MIRWPASAGLNVLLTSMRGIGCVIAERELSAWDGPQRKVHLLCYLPKNPDRLEGLMKHTRENRDKAMRESMHRVMRLFPVTEEHILRYAQGSSTLHHVHIRVL